MSFNTEWDAFQRILPDLMDEHLGSWVLFNEGEVQGFFESEREAYQAGVDKYESYGGFVVSQVAQSEPQYLTAAIAFGL